ncbi:MAG: hypothetical protein M1822_003285 [Bathelium mastoideum]|nr:MAG: hypothetical protein M1822_003285 [Bathelium mastoideum]
MVLEPPFSQGKTASTEQIWPKNSESKMDKGKAREKRHSSSDPIFNTGDEEGVRKHIQHDHHPMVFPTIYAAGTNLENGVFVVAGYEQDLVLFTIPPDVFAVSQRELQTVNEDKSEAGNDWMHHSIGSPPPTSDAPVPEDPSQSTIESAHPIAHGMEWFDFWPDTVSWSVAASLAGVNKSDPGSAPDDPGFLNSPPLTGPPRPGIWPLKIRGTWFAKVPTLVDIAVRNENGELVVWAFGADGHAHIFEVDSVRVQSGGHIPVRRKAVTISGDMADADDEVTSSWQQHEADTIGEVPGSGGHPLSDILRWLRKTRRSKVRQKGDDSAKSASPSVRDSYGAVDPSLRTRYQNEAINLTDDRPGGLALDSNTTLHPDALASDSRSDVSCAVSSDNYDQSNPSASQSIHNHRHDQLRGGVCYDSSFLPPRSSSSSPASTRPSSHVARHPESSSALSARRADTSQTLFSLDRTPNFRHARSHAWQTDLDDAPYELLMGDGHPNDIGRWAGCQSGRLTTFRPEPSEVATAAADGETMWELSATQSGMLHRQWLDEAERGLGRDEEECRGRSLWREDSFNG